MSEQKKTGSPGNSSLSSTKQLLDELDALMQRMLALPVGDGQDKEKSSSSQATGVMEAPTSPLVKMDSQKSDPIPPPVRRAAVTKEPTKQEPSAGEDPSSTSPEELENPQSYFYEQTDTGEPYESATYSDGLEDNPEHEEDDLSIHGEELEPSSRETDSDETDSLPESITYRFHSPDTENLPIITSERLTALTANPPVLESEPLIKRSKLLAKGTKRTRRWWLWPFSLLNRTFDAFTYLLGPLGSWLRSPGGRAFLGWVGLALLLASIVLQGIFWIRDH